MWRQIKTQRKSHKGMRVDMNGDCDIGFIQMEMCFLNYLKENQPTVYEELMKEKQCTEMV